MKLFRGEMIAVFIIVTLLQVAAQVALNRLVYIKTLKLEESLIELQAEIRKLHKKIWEMEKK